MPAVRCMEGNDASAALAVDYGRHARRHCRRVNDCPLERNYAVSLEDTKEGGCPVRVSDRCCVGRWSGTESRQIGELMTSPAERHTEPGLGIRLNTEG